MYGDGELFSTTVIRNASLSRPALLHLIEARLRRLLQFIAYVFKIVNSSPSFICYLSIQPLLILPNCMIALLLALLASS